MRKEPVVTSSRQARNVHGIFDALQWLADIVIAMFTTFLSPLPDLNLRRLIHMKILPHLLELECNLLLCPTHPFGR